jgi:glycosyltransferase involved in cell wall biosynthesis
MNTLKSYKLAYFVSHPIQYQAPLLRELAAHPQIELKVFFISDISTREFHDKGFGRTVSWNVSLLDGYDYEFLPCVFPSDSLSFIKPKVYGVKKAIKAKEWDAIWFHGYAHYSLVLGIILAFRYGIPYFFRAESNLICTSRNWLKNIAIKWLVKQASGLLWISSDNRDYYLEYGAKLKQLFFVPYAVDNKFFRENAESKKSSVVKIKQNLELNEPLPILIYASKFIKRKNPLLLFDAYAGLSKDGSMPPPAYLVYVGDGVERIEIEKRVAERGWQSHVKLIGFINQSELPTYFSMSDVFVLPSNKEPFGLVVNEAMSAGNAIISTDEVGATRDLIKHGKNGYICKAGDLNQMISVLRLAIDSREHLNEMALESQRIIGEWSYKQDIEGIVKALEGTTEARVEI